MPAAWGAIVSLLFAAASFNGISRHSSPPRNDHARGKPWHISRKWSSIHVPEDGPLGLSGQSNPVVLLLGLLSYVTVGASGQSTHARTVVQSFPVPRSLE